MAKKKAIWVTYENDAKGAAFHVASAESQEEADHMFLEAHDDEWRGDEVFVSAGKFGETAGEIVYRAVEIWEEYPDEDGDDGERDD